jgi:hypothetical protein
VKTSLCALLLVALFLPAADAPATPRESDRFESNVLKAGGDGVHSDHAAWAEARGLDDNA